MYAVLSKSCPNIDDAVTTYMYGTLEFAFLNANFLRKDTMGEDI